MSCLLWNRTLHVLFCFETGPCMSCFFLNRTCKVLFRIWNILYFKNFKKWDSIQYGTLGRGVVRPRQSCNGQPIKKNCWSTSTVPKIRAAANCRIGILRKRTCCQGNQQHFYRTRGNHQVISSRGSVGCGQGWLETGRESDIVGRW